MPTKPKTTLIRNAQVVNEGKTEQLDLLLRDGFIAQLAPKINAQADIVIDASGKYLLPGLIDDQVHFREPGLTHKATIETESRAALAGGITTFFEMPNTQPQTTNQVKLEEKLDIAKRTSWANYGFMFGGTNDNLNDILAVDGKQVPGIKLFLGSSTGNMLVDNPDVLRKIFSNTSLPISVHCEDEATIKANLSAHITQYGDDIPIEYHPIIRSEEACYKSSSHAISLAQEHNSKLHILHISTKEELELFEKIPLKNKNITCEACLHHMWFSNSDYDELGSRIKWNPAIKTSEDREAIIKAVNEGVIDVIATDHAPHTKQEKLGKYSNVPSGGPLIQYSLPILLEMNKKNKISIEKIVEKTSHNVAELFEIKDRGYIREGYFADITLFDLESKTYVNENNILSKCKWSPFENTSFNSKIIHTIVSGNHIYKDGLINGEPSGFRMEFNRD